MYFDCLIKVPVETGKITYVKRKNVTYVEYTYGRRYIAEKKYNIPQRSTIGKLNPDDETTMYPNPNFLQYFPDVELPDVKSNKERSGSVRIGTYIVIKKIIEEYGLDKMISDIIGRDSGLFLDLAAYSIITESNVAQYYPDYGFDHALFTSGMKIYSDTKISRFLNDMPLDASVRFLNEWNSKRDHREKIYISYDSTNKACQAGDIELTEIGHPKDGKDFPVINYSIAYDRDNRLPLFYESYPGSVVDVSQLQFMLEKAKEYGYRKAGFILDRGYFSKPNINYMDKNGFEFVIMVKGMKKLIREIILENRGTFEDVRSKNIRQYRSYGTTIERELFPSDKKKRYFHLYYSSSKHSVEQEQIEIKIDRAKKNIGKILGKAKELDKSYLHYFEPIYYHEGKEDQVLQAVMEKEEVIQEEIRLCGYYCIITSSKMTAKEALDLYKSRDASEKLFRGDKSYLGNKALRVYEEEAAEAKMLIEFIALIVRNKMYTSLKDFAAENDNKQNYMDVPAAIKELDKIQLHEISTGEYRLRSAVTATQKTILNAFKMDATYVQKEAAKISNALIGVN